MGFWGALGTIGGAALAPLTGGASLAIGSALGSAADAAGAEGKAAKQEAVGSQQAAALYDPYVQRGNDAGNTLAGLMGLPMQGGGQGMGVSASPVPVAPPKTFAQRAEERRAVGAPAPELDEALPPATLASLAARRAGAAPVSSYGRVN